VDRHTIVVDFGPLEKECNMVYRAWKQNGFDVNNQEYNLKVEHDFKCVVPSLSLTLCSKDIIVLGKR